MKRILPFLVMLLAGCATHNSLGLAESVNFGCTRNICWVYAPWESIDHHCKKTARMFDNGVSADTPGYRIRCCTKYRPGRKIKFTMYISHEDYTCVPHEFCHIEEFLAGTPTPHTMCHKFGVDEGKTKKRMK